MKFRGGEFSTGTTGNFQSELTFRQPCVMHGVKQTYQNGAKQSRRNLWLCTQGGAGDASGAANVRRPGQEIFHG